MPVQYSFDPWTRKMDGSNPAIVPHPKKRFYPGSLDELIEVIKEVGTNRDELQQVRACGSHWALSDAAVAQQYPVETNDPDNPERPRLNRQLYNVIPNCLSDAAMRFFIAQQVTPFNQSDPPDVDLPGAEFYLCHVEAGMRIYELYSRLDLGDDNQLDSLAAVLPQYKGPWALATMGGAGGQTIAGALSTGTHGGDVKWGPIADAVQAVHLLGPNGQQYWIERKLGSIQLTADDKLQSEYRNIEIHREEDFINAVVVAVGRMGIIYSVVLKVFRQFAMSETVRKDKWSSVRTWINNPANANFRNRFLQVVINPNGHVDDNNEHTCYITTRNIEPLSKAGVPPFGRAERGGPNAGHSAALGDAEAFFTIICKSDFPLKQAISDLVHKCETLRDEESRLAVELTGQILNPLTPPAVRSAAEHRRDVALQTVATTDSTIILVSELRSNLPVGRLGTTLAEIANWAVANQHLEILQLVNETVVGTLDHPERIAISYSLMDVHNYVDVQCIADADSLEVFLDGGSPALVLFIDRILQRMNDLETGRLTGTRLGFAGYAAMRFMGKAQALIAMQKWPLTCAIEIAGMKAIHGTQIFLRTLEQDAIDLGATVHWGQRNDLTMEQVEGMYNAKGPDGELFRWRQVLSRLSRNDQLFSTPFTMTRGLEAQPKF